MEVGGQKGSQAKGKGLGDGGGLGEGTAVARADRDVSAASVISRRLAAARGHRGARESRGMIEQTTLTTLAGGRGSIDKSKREEVIFEKLQKSPWKLA